MSWGFRPALLLTGVLTQGVMSGGADWGAFVHQSVDCMYYTFEGKFANFNEFYNRYKRMKQL